MRHLVLVVVVAALLAPAAGTAARMNYMDDPGDGGAYGAFYVCTPDGCGWWFCWLGQPCYPI